jgi:hypothetical protein
MEQYQNIIRDLWMLNPHATDIKIEISTNKDDLSWFKQTLHKYIKDNKMTAIGDLETLYENKFLEVKINLGTIKIINNE